MYSHIMVPVDLNLPPEVVRAAEVAGTMADWQGARLTLVSVTGTGILGAPRAEQDVAAGFAEARAIFAAHFDGEIETRNVVAQDVVAETNKRLAQTAEEIGADLIVVGTHAPRLTDWFLSGHASYLANHAPMSVLVVR